MGGAEGPPPPSDNGREPEPPPERAAVQLRKFYEHRFAQIARDMAGTAEAVALTYEHIGAEDVPGRSQVAVGRAAPVQEASAGRRERLSSRAEVERREARRLWELADDLKPRRPDLPAPGARDNGPMDNRDPVVDAWFETYDNPQKELVQAVRRVVLEADPRVTETIKWKAPTFMYEGNIASFYPRSTKHVSLMFHTGASLPDPTGLLEGEGDTSRVAKFLDVADLEAKADALRGLVAAWIASKG